MMDKLIDRMRWNWIEGCGMGMFLGLVGRKGKDDKRGGTGMLKRGRDRMEPGLQGQLPY